MKLIFQVNNQKHSLEIDQGEDLLESLDKFLKKNRIKFNSIGSLNIQEGGLTSQRIAETIIKIFIYFGFSSVFNK